MRTSDRDPLGSTNQQRTSQVGSPPVTPDPLLTAKEAAAYRRQGVSTLWRDVKEGRVPPPIRISPKAPRWRLSDLCPAREPATLQK